MNSEKQAEAYPPRSPRGLRFLAFLMVVIGVVDLTAKIGRLVRKEEVIFDFVRPLLTLTTAGLLLAQSRTCRRKEKA
jgi:hypothetical protein